MKKLVFEYEDFKKVEMSSKNFKSETCDDVKTLSAPENCVYGTLASFSFDGVKIETTWSCGIDRYFEEVNCTNDHFQQTTNGYIISIEDVKHYFDSVENSVSDWLES